MTIARVFHVPGHQCGIRSQSRLPKSPNFSHFAPLSVYNKYYSTKFHQRLSLKHRFHYLKDPYDRALTYMGYIFRTITHACSSYPAHPTPFCSQLWTINQWLRTIFETCKGICQTSSMAISAPNAQPSIWKKFYRWNMTVTYTGFQIRNVPPVHGLSKVFLHTIWILVV